MVSKLVRLGRYEYLILRFLSCRTSTVYDVYQGISNIYRGFACVYPCNVYTLASGLETQGFIRCVTFCPVISRGRFEITDQGRDALSAHLAIESRANQFFAITRTG